MDRISNAMVEVKFDAKSVAWRPANDPSDPASADPEQRDKARRLELTVSQALRGLMGLTDALPPKWATKADEEIASGAIAKHEPGADGWRWIVAPK